MMLGSSEASGVTQAVTAEFLDEVPGTSWSVPSIDRTNLNDRQPEVELAKYLSRPVLIKSHVWAQSDAYNTTTTWYPWHLFFNSTPIKNKINNYSFISCDLKLKFVVNASPFYSGAMAFTYCPLQNLAGTTIITDIGGGELMAYSQRPKVWVFPQTCQGGEITLPFFYHKNWLDLTSATDMQNMGTITPALYAALVSATGITGTSIVVNIYAWAENVKLHAPTTKLALQSDEFDYKPSQIASAAAAASGSLSRVPLIGPYMKATSMIMGSLSSVASSLGFTNVPNNSPVALYKPTAFPHNSTCEISVPTDRSAVDPKNEVTLDPRTVGLDGTDELSVAGIASRECWLGNAILSSTDAVDALTLVARVTPALAYQVSANTPIQFTPPGYVSTMFAHWRGDMIFRFKFICTRFHKGRVRISFDPTNDISINVPDYTTIFNEVVDIGAEQDIEVRVPYMQATTYLKTAFQTGNYNLLGAALAPSNTACNGLITMRVVNPLSGPVANTAIPVMVFVRAADNIEFAWPSMVHNQTTTLSPYTLQSAELVYPTNPCQVIAGNSITEGDPNRNLIHHGERVTSFRPLIHRMLYQYTILLPDMVSGSQFTSNSLFSSRRLKYAGFDPNGIWTGTKVVGVGSAPYNYQKMNIPQLVSLLFIGQRGSMNWSYNLESSSASTSNPPCNLTLKRFAGAITTASYNSVAVTATTTSSVMSQTYNSNLSEPNSGLALTDQRLQPGIVMNFPYYSQYNMQFVNPSYSTLGSAVDGTDGDNVLLQIINQWTASTTRNRVNVYAACGHDYNYFFFINTPSLYTFTVPAGV